MSTRIQLALVGVIAAVLPLAASARDGASLDQMMQMERQDFGVRPTTQLHGGPMHGPTPASIPGGQVITTFDVLGQPEMLPDAVPAAWLAQPGSFNDPVQRQAAEMLGQQTQGRTGGKGLAGGPHGTVDAGGRAHRDATHTAAVAGSTTSSRFGVSGSTQAPSM